MTYKKPCKICKRLFKPLAEFNEPLCSNCAFQFEMTATCIHCNASFVQVEKENYCSVCGEYDIYNHQEKGGKQNNKMVKLNEFAENYEPISTTKNIADLDSVSTDLELIDDEFEFTDKVTNEVKIVKQKIIVVEGEQYRVPNSVIGQLKIILEDNKALKKFKVKKTGIGLETRYMLIPLQ